MGIYNRDYYRESTASHGGNWGLDGLTPVVKYLLIANVAVFLLQIFVVREVQLSPLEMLRKFNPEVDKLLTAKEEGDPDADKALKKKYPQLDKLAADAEENNFGFGKYKVSIVQEWLELDIKTVQRGQVWRLLTYAFCHDRLSVWHILFNMLFLYWFGCTLESMYGQREFLLFYCTGAVVSALAFLGLELYTGRSVPCIGASGAVLSVMMLYTMHFPRQIIYICWVIPIEMRWVMVLCVIFDLHPVLLALARDDLFTGVANAAHLGGIAFGFLYARYQWRLEPLVERVPWPHWRWKRRPRLRLAPNTLPDPEQDVETERVDRVLAKIFESGQESLTDEERLILRQASERMKDRSRGAD
jgi:membrane associated rhomboid family serine protease